MIIRPKVRGFICTTAHPVGCAADVERQVEVARRRGEATDRFGSALVVGSSMGYGLASRIAVAWGCGADTVGVFLERPASGNRTATAGWYNSAAFHRLAREDGLVAESVNGDAFSPEIKSEVVDLVREKLGSVDLLIYSLAAPRRRLPDGTVATSSLKPIGEPYRNKTVDVTSGELSEVEIEPATDEEVADTVKVMGGEDWELWIDALDDAGALAPDVVTLAYSYIGPELTYPIYREGTIGRAKDHLEATAQRLDERLSPGGGHALVSVNKAVVTQSSSAIPVVPLYMSILFPIMKEKDLHEGTIEQMTRLVHERLARDPESIPVDVDGRIRLDDLEMRADVQEEVERRWKAVDDETLPGLADLEGYRSDFLRLFGFGIEGVDEDEDVDPDVSL